MARPSPVFPAYPLTTFLPPPSFIFPSNTWPGLLSFTLFLLLHFPLNVYPLSPLFLILPPPPPPQVEKLHLELGACTLLSPPHRGEGEGMQLT